ncbi:hypothetical protein RND81_03G236600 [Saponaria officinalis]|uniref:PPC domain-containing protein n=1 Tax=Saponaria officinalis TaxID=3572 RepID=A0AAW1M2K2_SAPOF
MMKGEYREHEEEDDDDVTQRHFHHHNIPTNSTPQMFSDFHPRPKFLSPPHFLSPHHPYHPPPPPHPLPLSETTPLKQPPPPPSKKPRNTPTSSEDAGTIELSRRPRGRPPGSKNKPKPVVVLTREPDPNMSPYILELPNGSDIIDSLTRFTRRRGHSLCVMNATGAVANVTLKQPSVPTTPSHGTVTFHGRYDVLSLSGVILVTQTVPLNRISNEFAISLAGPQGQIIGGKVAGRLICSATVYVVATSFDNPSFCRLPLEEVEIGNNHGGDGGQSSSPVSQDGGGDGGGGAHVGMYNSSNEVMWGNNSSGSRPPQPNY